jgi:hypothetical protein
MIDRLEFVLGVGGESDFRTKAVQGWCVDGKRILKIATVEMGIHFSRRNGKLFHL